MLMSDPFLEAFEARRAAREQADRSFPLAGETLSYRPSVAPEVGMRLERMRQQVRGQMERLKAAADKAEQASSNGGAEAAVDELAAALDNLEVSDTDMLQIGDETVLACLTPESAEAWARLRSPGAPQPLTFDEVFEFADYLLGRVAGIPTSAPADSSAGRTETASKSTAASSSPAATPTG
jgi:hypothetical protein